MNSPIELLGDLQPGGMFVLWFTSEDSPPAAGHDAQTVGIIPSGRPGVFVAMVSRVLLVVSRSPLDPETASEPVWGLVLVG